MLSSFVVLTTSTFVFGHIKDLMIVVGKTPNLYQFLWRIAYNLKILTASLTIR
jgi:hypothetical protein